MMITSKIEEPLTELAEARNALVAHAEDLARLTDATRMKLPRLILRLASVFAQCDPRYVNMAQRTRLEQAISQATFLRNQIIAILPDQESAISMAIEAMNHDLRNIRAAKIG